MSFEFLITQNNCKGAVVLLDISYEHKKGSTPSIRSDIESSSGYISCHCISDTFWLQMQLVVLHLSYVRAYYTVVIDEI